MLMGLGIAYGVRVYIVLDETDNIDSACVCAVLKTTKLAVLSVTSDVTCTYFVLSNIPVIALLLTLHRLYFAIDYLE